MLLSLIRKLCKKIKDPKKRSRQPVFILLRRLVTDVYIVEQMAHKPGIKSDYDLYMAMNAYFSRTKDSTSTVAPPASCDANPRARRRAAEIAKILHEQDIDTAGATYYDYGCADGTISRALGLALGARESWCGDIGTWQEKSNIVTDTSINFLPIEKSCIFSDDCPKKFTIITAPMVFHHIDPKELWANINTLVQRLAFGGHLVVREHDAESQDTVNLCHVEHALHAMVMSSTPDREFFTTYTSNYLPSASWIKVIESCGISLVHRTEPYGVTRNHYLIFRR